MSRRLHVKPEIVIAIAATVVSLCALATTIYQTYILQQQQHAAVWPRLELMHGWRANEDNSFYRLSVRNTGVGPAIVRKLAITYQDGSVETFGELALIVARQGGLPDTLAYQDYSRLMPNMVIPQQEERIILYLNQAAYIKNLVNVLEDIEVTLQYESLYGDAWEVTYPHIEHQKID